MEAVLACGPADAAQVMCQLRIEGLLHYVLQPRTWHVLAPSEHHGKAPPPGFPGSRAQYVTYLRMKSGKNIRCELCMALHEVLQGTCTGESEVYTQALEDFRSESFAKQEEVLEEVKGVKRLIEEEFTSRFGPRPSSLVGMTKVDALAQIRREEEQLKLRRQAVMNQAKGEAAEKREEREEAKRARKK